MERRTNDRESDIEEDNKECLDGSIDSEEVKENPKTNDNIVNEPANAN